MSALNSPTFVFPERRILRKRRRGSIPKEGLNSVEQPYRLPAPLEKIGRSFAPCPKFLERNYPTTM